MARHRRAQIFIGISALALSACATIPTDREAAAPAGALLEARKKYQEDARRFEREGRLRDSLERWKIVSTIDSQQAEARQKQTELETRIQQQARQHVAAGKEQLQRRDKVAAQREFLAALRLDPMSREAREQLYLSEEQLGEQTAFARPLRGTAQAKIALSRKEESKAAIDEETEESEETGEEVSFAEAAELFRKGDYLGAIEAFNRVLAHQPGMREAIEYQKLAYYNQGVAYNAKENYAEALKMFERLRRIQPDFKRLPHYIQTAREKLADQHYLAGIRQYKEKKLKEAIEEWDQALALNPKLENARRSKERARGLLKSLEGIK